jgi:hypothetical protein
VHPTSTSQLIETLTLAMPFNRLNHNILGEIRPRFVLEIECEADLAIEHLKKQIINDNSVSTLKANYTVK